MSAARLHPLGIAPGVIEVPYHRGRPWRLLVINPEGVGFIAYVTVMMRGDVVLVERSLSNLGNETFPDARATARMQEVRLRIPLVEVADHRYRTGVGSPYAENSSGFV